MKVDTDILDPDDMAMLYAFHELTRTFPYLKWDHVIASGLNYWEEKRKEVVKG